MNKALLKAPTLKVVSDDAAATKLRELLKDADDGFRRVVKVGLYIEWIAANLPHGQLMSWLEAHAPDVSQRSIYNWRSLAKNLCEWSGLKFASLANMPMSADKLLDCPVKDLSPALQKVRGKMDEALGESHSAKQLFLHLGFKQSEIDSSTGYPKAKRGQAKGSKGCTKEMRLKAQYASEAERLEALKLWTENAVMNITDNLHLKGFALLDEVKGGKKILEDFTEVIADAHSFLQNLKKSRASQPATKH